MEDRVAVSEKPLMELEESLMFGLWPRRLLIFEDRIEAINPGPVQETTESRKYGWVDRVLVADGKWFANLLIKSYWGKPILMRGLDKDVAARAGTIIEERISGAGKRPKAEAYGYSPDPDGLIRKLADLREAGILSQEEFEAKKAAVLRRDRGFGAG